MTRQDRLRKWLSRTAVLAFMFGFAITLLLVGDDDTKVAEPINHVRKPTNRSIERIEHIKEIPTRNNPKNTNSEEVLKDSSDETGQFSRKKSQLSDLTSTLLTSANFGDVVSNLNIAMQHLRIVENHTKRIETELQKWELFGQNFERNFSKQTFIAKTQIVNSNADFGHPGSGMVDEQKDFKDSTVITSEKKSVDYNEIDLIAILVDANINDDKSDSHNFLGRLLKKEKKKKKKKKKEKK
ncbi:hypothetical protein ACHAXS_003203, partial [Conticribra weissflogii]